VPWRSYLHGSEATGRAGSAANDLWLWNAIADLRADVDRVLLRYWPQKADTTEQRMYSSAISIVPQQARLPCPSLLPAQQVRRLFLLECRHA